MTRHTAGGRTRARLAIRRAMEEKGIETLDHILGRGVTDRCEASDFWPTPDQCQQIELLLDWPYGTIEAIAIRPPYEALDGPTHALVNMIWEMEPADRTALIELLKVTRIRAKLERPDEADAIDRHLRLITGEG